MNIKIAASKSFLLGGGLVLICMLFTTIYIIANGEIEGVDLYTAPLMGFYVALPTFIITYPILILVFIIIDIFKSKRK